MSFRPATTKKHQIAIIALVLATLIWSGAGPVIKYTLQYIPPFTFLMLRFLVASVIILPFLIFEEQKEKVSRKDWVNLIILALLGGTVNLALTFWGFEYTSALEGSLLTAISPVFMIIASYKLLGEKVTKNEKIGVAIALAGTIFIVIEPMLSEFKNGQTASFTRFVGNLLIIAASIVWVAYTIWSKKIFEHKPTKFDRLLHFLGLRINTKEYSPLFVTGLMSVISLISFIPLSAIELRYVALKNPRQSVQVVTENADFISSNSFKPLMGVLYMGVLSTLVAYGLYTWSLKELPAGGSSIFSYLQPIFAIPFSFLLLGEKVDTTFIIGGLIIAVGVYFSEFRAKAGRD